MSDYSTEANSNRNKWEFNYAGTQVLEGAQTKKKYHESRLSFWNNRKEKVKSEIKSDGMSFDESQSDATSNSRRTTGINVREDLMRDLNECNERIKLHHAKIAGYEAWIEVLGSQREMTLPLTQNDWMYFFSDVK